MEYRTKVPIRKGYGREEFKKDVAEAVHGSKDKLVKAKRVPFKKLNKKSSMPIGATVPPLKNKTGRNMYAS